MAQQLECTAFRFETSLDQILLEQPGNIRVTQDGLFSKGSECDTGLFPHNA